MMHNVGLVLTIRMIWSEGYRPYWSGQSSSDVGQFAAHSFSAADLCVYSQKMMIFPFAVISLSILAKLGPFTG